MSLDAVQKVVLAERAAGEMRSEAESRAKALLAQAQSQGKQRLEAAIADAGKQGRALLDQAEENARLHRAEVLAQVQAECDRLRAGAAERMNGAVRRIIGKVVSGGWQ